MMESLLFKNVDIVLPFSIRRGDVLVEKGRVAAVESSLKAHADWIIAEHGLTLMPGVIDTHVHFREPGMEWKEDLESGSKAAAAGGVTSFLDMPNNKPPITTVDLLEKKKELARKKSLVNFNFFMGATAENVKELIQAENIPGIKIFMGSSTGELLVDNPNDLDFLFSKGNRLIAVHAEDEAIIQKNKQQYLNSKDVKDHMRIRSPEAAFQATKFAVQCAKKYQRRLHILHLTTEEEVDFLKHHKQDGLISCEVTPQHLLLSGPSIYDQWGGFAQINPPIREERHRQALWTALKEGIIDSIASDHAPHTWEEKQTSFGKIPSGMPGVETMLSLMTTLVHQKKCTLLEVTRWLCEKPAMLYGLKGKGKIVPGYDGDLILLDLKKTRVLSHDQMYTQCKWTVFHGQKVVGLPIATFVNGNMVFREGDFFTDIKGKELVIKREA